MAEVKLKQGLLGEDGKVIENSNERFTLQTCLARAILAQVEDKKVDKEKDFELYLKVKGATKNTIDLKAEEISVLKEKVKQVYSTLIAGQVCYILEGKDNPLK